MLIDAHSAKGQKRSQCLTSTPSSHRRYLSHCSWYPTRISVSYWHVAQVHITEGHSAVRKPLHLFHGIFSLSHSSPKHLLRHDMSRHGGRENGVRLFVYNTRLVVYVACITTLPLIRAVARVRPGWTACTLLFFCCCCCCRHLSNSQQGYCCDFVMPKRRGPGFFPFWRGRDVVHFFCVILLLFANLVLAFVRRGFCKRWDRS